MGWRPLLLFFALLPGRALADTLILKNGQTLTQKVHRPLGRGPENPLPAELLEAKFANCAARAMSPNQVPALLAQLRTLETLPTVGVVTDLMAQAAR